MEKFRLGKTDLMITRCGFGALPIQRTEMSEAKKILRKAYDSGINFFDTANAYSNSEEKIGEALSAVRSQIIIATKTGAKDVATLQQHLELSLKRLQTDYIDIYQLHNPQEWPSDEMYEALLQAKKSGKIRCIGITNHSRDLALKAIKSGLYDTIQFPLSYISSDKDLEIIAAAKEADVGVIAMKGLCGGLITNIPAAVAFLRQYDNLVPIWGIQHEWELDEFLNLYANPPQLTEDLQQAIARDCRELAGSFCRGCGYCLPCQVGINIPFAARMQFLLRRAPYQPFLTPEWEKEMNKIDACLDCGHCKSRCPYHLDTPELLRHMLRDYREFAKEKRGS